MRNPQIIAVHAQKGGCGKTTLCAHLAAQAARCGRQVLLVDLDPQQSIRRWWDRRPTDDLVLSVAPPIGDVVQAARDHRCDLVVIDTPPRSAASTLAALQIADLILVPCQPSILDVDALDQVAELIGHAKAAKRHAVILNRCPAPRGVLQGEASVVAETRQAITTGFGLTVSPTTLCERAAFRHAMIGGQSVFDFEPGGKAAAEMQKLWDYVEGRLS